MKILFVCARLPFPADDGWKMRTAALIRSLAAHGHSVDLLTYVVGENVEAALNGHRNCLNDITTVPRAKSYAPADLVRGLILPEPFPVFNSRQGNFARAMRDLLHTRRYDAVQVEDISMAQYALDAPAPLKVLDMHNVESSLMHRYSVREGSWAKALYAGITARKLARYEQDVTQHFDLVTVCSDDDKALLASSGVRARIEVIPNGVWCDAYKPAPEGEKAREAVFIGRLDYHANVTGARFLVREILPLLLERLPDAQVNLVGKNPGPAVQSLQGPAVTVYGDVPDVIPFLTRASVVAVPLLVGGGTRLKILEAMACGKAVVSTRIGAEGIPATHGEHILLTDSPEEFAAAMASLMEDAAARRRLGDAARRFVAEQYDWRVIGDFLDGCLGGAMRRQRPEERA